MINGFRALLDEAAFGVLYIEENLSAGTDEGLHAIVGPDLEKLGCDAVGDGVRLSQLHAGLLKRGHETVHLSAGRVPVLGLEPAQLPG